MLQANAAPAAGFVILCCVSSTPLNSYWPKALENEQKNAEEGKNALPDGRKAVVGEGDTGLVWRGTAPATRRGGGEGTEGRQGREEALTLKDSPEVLIRSAF